MLTVDKTEGEDTLKASHHSSLSGKELVDEENKIELHLRLLQTTPKHIPRWMKHYRLASYIIYSIVALFSLVYLLYIGVTQANLRFEIQYTSIVRYLEYNSYSILSPLLSPLLMGMLIYQVRCRIKLDEGDFFGILGLLLILALISIHDMWGILQLLHGNHDPVNKLTGHMDPPSRDDSSKNDLHWQYAWSTRTTCARKFVRDLLYKHEYSKKHVVRQIIFKNSDPMRRLRRSVDSSKPHFPNNIQCNLYHNVKRNAIIRGWMRDIQNEYKCCGPYGYNQWKQWFTHETLTGCKKEWINKATGDIPSCFDPLMRWLDDIMTVTFWLMLIQAITYLVCMIVAGLHHSAMKFEHEKIEKRYSLLSLVHHSKQDLTQRWWLQSRPPDKVVIVGEYPEKSEEGDVHNANGENSQNPRNTSKRKLSKGDNDSDGRSSGKAKRKHNRNAQAPSH